MTWPAVFLACFVIGFVLSALSFATSLLHLHFHFHLPFGHGVHGTAVHAAHGGRVVAADAHGAPLDGAADPVSPVNFATVMAFLAWFGGTGYLLSSQFRWWAGPALLVAAGVGLVGASIVFLVMARVLWSPDENMRSVDYHMVGVLGRVSSPIRGDGLGEVIYSLGGTRRACPARTADGAAIEKGAEVVVTAYERGIAAVRRWSDFEREAGSL